MQAPLRNVIAEEAARIVCSESLIDYHAAKLKALHRLGLPSRHTSLPDNGQVDAAVIDYLRLFGGAAYTQRLARMRQLAPRLMRSLAAFEPRLTGGAVSGAVTVAHHLQLHVFAEQSELLDMFLLDRGIDFDIDERRYKYPGGREEQVPLLRFSTDGVGVDLAVFMTDDLRRTPISPMTGLPYARLNLDEAIALASN
ncbi:hypothetical protein [Solimonas marina]|uniref:Uncharacterized protein n=1 Tax=Solimonas marina TaxID=2714601 RepID=A0A969W7Z4_9GAMM|nr:hypothetical protein [Solimonas marina]NKF21154.1 hypothetical protein [Solimonas marina]